MRELEPNAEFDLSLRPRWQAPSSRRQALRIRELGLHWLVGAGPDDSLRLAEAVPEEFLDHLRSHELAPPTITVAPAVCREAELTPFGWNRAAAELNRRYRRPAERAPLEVIRRVNGRSFAAELARELFDDPLVVGEITSPAELEHRLRRLSAPPDGWVLKSEHGNAGLGNRRLRVAELGEGDHRFVERLFAEDDAALLEEWRPREADLCAVFDVAAGGECGDLGVHEAVTTADGAFIGALFDDSSELIGRWRSDLEAAGTVIAGRLAAAGYTGPVCVDAFVFRDGEASRLRPLVDLNGRRHVSAPVRRLWRHRYRGSVLFWRFFARRKLELPPDLVDLTAALGGDVQRRGRGPGLVVTSPLVVGGSVPQSLSVLIVGRSRDEVMALEGRFRERFER